MKKIHLFPLLCLFLSMGWSQKTASCAYCNMIIRDARFSARAELTEVKTLDFDAIECLVNYVVANEVSPIGQLLVSGYNSEGWLDAHTAHYLKSQGIPSPMGGNLSAYPSKEAATAMARQKDGVVHTWAALLALYKDNRVGTVEHEGHDHSRPDTYGPSGIMGDHLHPKGGFMTSFRSMQMNMNGNRDGSRSLPDDMLLDGYMVTPRQMSMYMYMLGMMYAPTDKLTLTFMQHYTEKEMDLRTQMTMGNGMAMTHEFSTGSSGFGDMYIGMLYGLYSQPAWGMHLNLGISLPFGSIGTRDATPMLASAPLPYAMQLGSGTFDYTLGATFRGQGTYTSWGVQQLNTIRTGVNNRDYRLGNLYEFHTWAACRLHENISMSFRLSGSIEGDIKGADPELNPIMAPTTDPDNYGGERLSAGLGINFLLAKDKLILSGEIGTPLYQKYNGILMDEGLFINTSARIVIF